MSGEALAIGTVLQAYGSIRSGQSKSEAYQLEARAKEAQSAQVDIAANREIDLTRRRYDRIKSAQISAFGRSGVQLSGTPLLMLEESAANAFDEIRTIESAARYRKQTLMTESELSRFMGDDAEVAGMLSGASSILTGFSKNPYIYDRRIEDKGKL
jgi:hypothetical protein